MKKIIFLTEGGIKSGLGHISRCSALYDAFEEGGCSPLMVINGDDTIKRKVFQKNVLFNDWITTIEQQGTADIAVVDSYSANEELCQYISRNFPLTVFLDDTIRIRYPKGIVLNGALFSEEMNYPKDAEVMYLLGSAYALLQKTFWNTCPRKAANKIENILLTMGGIDAGNLTAKIVRWLSESFPTVKINIPAGINFKTHDEIEKRINSNINLIYNAGADEMRDLMSKADIAISSSGQTLFELARMGVPTIAIQTASNQRHSIMGWKKTRFIEYAGEWDNIELSKNILSCFRKLDTITARRQKSEIGKNLIDGQGARRVVKKIMYN